MQFTTSLVLSALALTSSVAAQTVQSAPFKLLAITPSTGNYSQYNGSAFASCHEGAAIESLCITSSATGGSTYNLNTTQGGISNVPGDSVPGTLVWSLSTGSPDAYSEALNFYIDPSTNVALPLFGLGQGVAIAFDQDDLMNVQTNYVDTVTPPQAGTQSYAYYRWNLCETNFEGYAYTTLTWVYGEQKAQNPSCVPVSVKRVFT